MKRLPIIRHIRFFWHRGMMANHYARCAEMGCFGVSEPQEFELQYLEDIWNGIK